MSRRVLAVAKDTSEEPGGKVKDTFPGKVMPRPGKPSAVRGSAEAGRVRLEGPKGFGQASQGYGQGFAPKLDCPWDGL
jgi:hypothetical protein